jgi:RND family efflux transporter MFP subunit
VKQGDLLAVMDDDVLQASLAVARRTMSAEGMLKSAQADLNMKKVELEKLTQLRERNHASQQELSRIETELLVAEARLLSVQEDLAVKRLEFDRIEAQVAQRKILAPIDGIISELFREKGEFVSPSDPTIARIVQLDPLLVVFSLPLGQRKEVMKDQRVTLKIGEDERVQEGVVEYVSPTSDPSNSSVRVKVRIPNSEGHFQSGERAVLATSPAEQVSPGEQPESSPLARREL